MMLDPRRIIIVWESSSPRVDAFAVAPKAPAGQVSNKPEFTLYLGVNTGPYQTTDNGTVILPPVPIEWIIAPLNVTSGQCPSRGANLGLFVATNAIVLGLILIVGCRPLVRFLTGGLLGQPSRRSVYWTWIFSFALQAASNAVVSHLVVSTPGYQHLSMLNIFALYSSRPRINWIWTGLLRIFIGPVRVPRRMGITKKEKKKKNTKNQSEALPAHHQSQLLHDLHRDRDDDNTPSHEWIYTDSYVATSIAEFVLQLMSAVFVGVTWQRFPNEPIREHMKNWVNLMIAAPALALVGWALVPVWVRRDEDVWEDRNACAKIILAVICLGLPGFFTYGVAWKYWDEFLLLPGSL